MTVRKLTPDPCPDHPRKRTYFTSQTTSGQMNWDRKEVLQYVCGEAQCNQELGWVYESFSDNRLQETLSGSTSCPQELLQRVRARIHENNTANLTLLAITITVFITVALYITLSRTTDATWSILHSVGMVADLAICTAGILLIRRVMRRNAPKLYENTGPPVTQLPS